MLRLAARRLSSLSSPSRLLTAAAAVSNSPFTVARDDHPTSTPHFYHPNRGFISCWKNSLAGAINSQRCLIHTTGIKEADNPGIPDSMSFVKGILDADVGSNVDFPQPQYNLEKSDIVHIKLLKNNTFVTITDSKGNKKFGASAGSVEELKGGPNNSRYATEATAEHAGNAARDMGLRSVVVRVNGFIHFKKKRQAILSFREGLTSGRGDRNPINYIEDTTRRPHNGCRLPKKRRF